jgi:hypothetical protein
MEALKKKGIIRKKSREKKRPGKIFWEKNLRLTN